MNEQDIFSDKIFTNDAVLSESNPFNLPPQQIPDFQRFVAVQCKITEKE
jgi:hypothetical protein